MIILNFTHPLTSSQLDKVTEIVGSAPERIENVRVQLDLNQPFDQQVIQILDTLAISTEQWQSGGWLVVLPALNYAAGVMLAEIHGRMGHFPAIVRLRPVTEGLVTEYDVAEIINLEVVRSKARSRR